MESTRVLNNMCPTKLSLHLPVVLRLIPSASRHERRDPPHPHRSRATSPLPPTSSTVPPWESSRAFSPSRPSPCYSDFFLVILTFAGHAARVLDMVGSRVCTILYEYYDVLTMYDSTVLRTRTNHRDPATTQSPWPPRHSDPD